jgi:hypothetical protein
MLVAEEAITTEMAILPLLIFEQGRSHHRLDVQMPEAVEMYDDLDELQKNARRRIRARGGFDKALEKVATRPEVVPEPRPRRAPPVKTAKAAAGKAPRVRLEVGTSSRVVLALCAAAALAGVLWAFLSLYTPRASDFDMTGVASSLTLQGTKRQGTSLSAVIVDPLWGGMGPEKRREAVQRMAESMDIEGVQTLTLFDPQMRVVAVSLPGKDGAGWRVLLGEEIFAHATSGVAK